MLKMLHVFAMRRYLFPNQCLQHEWRGRVLWNTILCFDWMKFFSGHTWPLFRDKHNYFICVMKSTLMVEYRASLIKRPLVKLTSLLEEDLTINCCCVGWSVTFESLSTGWEPGYWSWANCIQTPERGWQAWR